MKTNSDENDKNEVNSDENYQNEFNTNENDKNKFSADKNVLKLYDKVKDNCHYIQENLEELPIIFAIYNTKHPKNSSNIHNGMTYDYYECKECKKRWLMSINGLIKKFPNVYQFCNRDTNKFVLLLRKGVYPYEYMESWGRFDEPSLPNKKFF